MKEKGIDPKGFKRRSRPIAVVVVANEITKSSLREPAEPFHFPSRKLQLDVRVNEKHRSVLFPRPIGPIIGPQYGES